MSRRVYLIKWLALFVLLIFTATAKAQQKDIPREWIETETGHRVIRLSDEPGSASLYFHQNPYTPDGQKLIITTPTGLSAINLKTRAIEKLLTMFPSMGSLIASVSTVRLPPGVRSQKRPAKNAVNGMMGISHQ